MPTERCSAGLEKPTALSPATEGINMSTTDREELDAIVEEAPDGQPFLKLLPSMAVLRFRNPTTLSEAHEAVRWMRRTFAIRTIVPPQTPAA
jgi:hypothetical protein